jgi:hypothetical protein
MFNSILGFIVKSFRSYVHSIAIRFEIFCNPG